MSYSFLESSEQEWLPTIDIIWEISRQLGYRKVADIDEFWQQVDNFGGFEEDASAADKMAQLGRHFYRQLGYSDAPESWVKSHRILVHDVCMQRTGVPLVLAMLLHAAAHRHGLHVQLIDFPGYPLLKYEAHNQAYFFDPHTGESVRYEDIVHRFDHLMDGDAEFCWEWAEATPQSALIEAYLTELKQCFMAEARFEKALRCIEMLLVLRPNDPYEIRDRGYLYEELGCQHIAADDYQFFVEQCPDDPSAQLLKLQLENYAGPSHIVH